MFIYYLVVITYIYTYKEDFEDERWIFNFKRYLLIFFEN